MVFEKQIMLPLSGFPIYFYISPPSLTKLRMFCERDKNYFLIFFTMYLLHSAGPELLPQRVSTLPVHIVMYA